ncbi:MAG: DUF2207 domain-containing protein [Ardenticatenaceae bacterium]|nr:DUF2207 domain-containing protein [Ardenticatenaceae bacterium]MCB9442997.1 DUF2207 domain-containing protein [Ardenticatenaceae bacterium]
MTKKTKQIKHILPFLLLFFILLLQPQNSFAQTKSFYWSQFDVDITLLESGDMRVVETQTLDFSGAPFTYGYGTIYTGSKGNNDGIVDISVSDDKGSYIEASNNAERTFKVSRSSDEVSIYWYFEPTVGSRTFKFSYTVVGGIQVGTLEAGDGDQIYWKAIPADHPSWIEASRVTIHLPEGVQPQINSNTGDYLVAAYVDEKESDRVQINVGDNGRTITYDLQTALATDQQLEVRVQFPHGILNITTPDWQKRAQQADAISLAVVVIALLILIGGPLAVLLLWYARGRDPELGIVVPEYITEPPNNLPPAVVGTLVDEKADMRDIISTLLDLARRGYITITEEQNNHVFNRTEKSDSDLRPFEQRFLKDIFRGQEERSLNSLRYKFADKLPNLRKMLYQELVTDGLVPRSPETVRNSYGCFSFVIMAAAVGAFFAVPAILGADIVTAVCPAFAIGLTGVAFLVVSRVMPAKTQKGTETAAQWQAFRNYLQNIDQYRSLEDAGDIFEKYLPYATAFGLERTWIRKFTAVSTTPMPTWYHPYPYYGRPFGHMGKPASSIPGGGMTAPSLEGMSGSLTGGLESMSKGLTRMLNSTSTIMKSTPPSSSSGRSSGGFSGGFSGGGFSSGGGGSRGFG